MRKKTLKRLISRYMYIISCLLVAAILIFFVCIQISTEQRQAYEEAERIIIRIESVMEENQRELEEIREEYRQTCLHNAETVARIIEGDPEASNNVEELNEIAEAVEVDEIHIIDKTGRIFSGTHPKYFGLTFDSGEQIGFFKPMLEDKTLKLVQDISPNTGENKLMQYSAVWSEDGEFIVQVGMSPVNVMKVTEKNELSYIFSMFRVNPNANYYAIDAESGEIVGSTDLDTVGLKVSEIGVDFEQVKNAEKGFHTKIKGRLSFCVFEEFEGNYVGRVVTAENLYRGVPLTALWVFMALSVVAFFLAHAVVRYMNRYVVQKLHAVNDKLKSIEDGHWEEHVDIQSSVEFAELSNYINSMVKSLVDNNRKISYALSKTNMYIGTYEYAGHTSIVRYTEYIPKILDVDEETMERLASDSGQFAAFLDDIRSYPVQNEQGVFQHGGQYIRLEEIRNEEQQIFGVAVDVTAETRKRLKIEKERDIDALTGLYNRRGLNERLKQLFRDTSLLKYSALIMIDADGLKKINDSYGHDVGDIYLKKLGEAIAKTGTRSSVVSRLGGDEFVLFLYDYESREELEDAIRTLEYIQSNSYITLDENIEVALRFSFGYSLPDGETDYHSLLREADGMMYQDKIKRRESVSS